MNKNLILFALFILSGIFYYVYASQPQIVSVVSRVIDGDTLELSSGEKVRLLGINTPEKTEPLSNQSIALTKSLVEGKEVKIKSSEKDKYGRLLGYVFIDGKMLNEELIKAGLAHTYFYETDKYSNELSKAEDFAMQNNLGIWKKSRECIQIVDVKYQEQKRCTNQERIVILNSCDEKVEVTLKDTATHIFHETLNVGENSFNFSCIFNDEGDTVYVYEDDGLLDFERYS